MVTCILQDSCLSASAIFDRQDSKIFTNPILYSKLLDPLHSMGDVEVVSIATFAEVHVPGRIRTLTIRSLQIQDVCLWGPDQFAKISGA